MNTLFCKNDSISNFFNKDSIPSAVLISTVSVGLLITYVIMVYNIRTYYKDKMQS